MPPDPYARLGLKHGATPDEVKQAFRTLAKKYHPDLHTMASADVRQAAAQRFKDITDAYETIKDDRPGHRSGPYSQYGNPPKWSSRSPFHDAWRRQQQQQQQQQQQHQQWYRAHQREEWESFFKDREQEFLKYRAHWRMSGEGDPERWRHGGFAWTRVGPFVFYRHHVHTEGGNNSYQQTGSQYAGRNIRRSPGPVLLLCGAMVGLWVLEVLEESQRRRAALRQVLYEAREKSLETKISNAPPDDRVPSRWREETPESPSATGLEKEDLKPDKQMKTYAFDSPQAVDPWWRPRASSTNNSSKQVHAPAVTTTTTTTTTAADHSYNPWLNGGGRTATSLRKDILTKDQPE